MSASPNEPPAQEKKGVLQLLAEGKRHPVIIFIAVVISAAAGTFAVLKTGVVPRSWYMPSEDVVRLENHQQPQVSPKAAATDDGVTIRTTPARQAEPTPDPAFIKGISTRGMDAVHFMLRFESANDAGKEAIAKENDGKTVDWDLAVKDRGRMQGETVEITCSPPYFNYWSQNSGFIVVGVKPKFDNVALSLENETIVHVRAVLDLTFPFVDLKDAEIERMKEAK